MRCFCPPDSFTPRSPIDGVQPVRETGDHFFQPRAPRRLPDFLVGRFQSAVGDILADRAREQKNVLLHDADVLAQRGQCHLPDIDTVNCDPPRIQVIKSG